MHLIHLSPMSEGPAVDPGHFITAFGGFCANCHTVGFATCKVGVKADKEAQPPPK